MDKDNLQRKNNSDSSLTIVDFNKKKDEISTNNSKNKESKENEVKLSDIAKDIRANTDLESKVPSIDTTKKRLRKIIKDNNIPYTDGSGGWTLSENNLKSIMSLYKSKWSGDLVKVTKADSKETAELKHSLQTSAQQIKELTQTREKDAEQIKSLSKKNDDLTAQVQKTNDKLTKLTEQLNISVQQAHELNRRQDSLMRENTAITKKLEEYQTNANELSRKFENAQTQIIDQQNDIADKDQEIQELKEKNDKLVNRGFWARLFNKDAD